ncbi:MAG: aminotransferase, partial [Clostridia bacterium]|nr:aminotransferase [Clostridia bacterium]
MDYNKMNREELAAVLEDERARFNKYKARGLKLDMTRGKPGPDQLKLSEPMLEYGMVDGGISD